MPCRLCPALWLRASLTRFARSSLHTMLYLSGIRHAAVLCLASMQLLVLHCCANSCLTVTVKTSLIFASDIMTSSSHTAGLACLLKYMCMASRNASNSLHCLPQHLFLAGHLPILAFCVSETTHDQKVIMQSSWVCIGQAEGKCN